jgi:hypothetical protein
MQALTSALSVHNCGEVLQQGTAFLQSVSGFAQGYTHVYVRREYIQTLHVIPYADRYIDTHITQARITAHAPKASECRVLVKSFSEDPRSLRVYLVQCKPTRHSL